MINSKSFLRKKADFVFLGAILSALTDCGWAVHSDKYPRCVASSECKVNARVCPKEELSL